MPDEKKTKFQELSEKIMLKRQSSWLGPGKADEKRIFDFAEGYVDFLGKAKVESEAVETVRKMAEKRGFSKDTKSQKYYVINRGKNIALVVRGKSKGLNIAIAHADSPRLDLKAYPLYEDGDLALLKTHYYGGIKKYHWVSERLALHGKIVVKGGKTIDILIGEDPSDPVFTIADLLPHLGKKMAEKPIKEAIEAEQLNIIAGNIPVDDEKVEGRFKLRVMSLLNMKYGITEEDLVSAEIHAVPAGPARDLGFDRSMVIGYGQDDKASVYTGMMAALDAKPGKTIMLLVVDKEEIGSEGATGAQSYFIEEVVRTITDEEPRMALSKAKVLSCDVNSALDPSFRDSFEPLNANYLGRGPTISIVGGSGGKYDSSDAGAPYTRELIDILNKNKIPWQAGELGKVDEGGGGTISKYTAKYNCDIIDFGAPVMAMHAPMEISSKADIYYSYKGIRAFYEEM